jgi:integrase/recombinase XerD
MATLKLTMDTRRYSGLNKYPIIIRLTHQTKSTSITTDVKVVVEEWDSSKGRITKVHPNHKELNLKLNNRVLELEKKILQLDSKVDELNTSELKNVLLNINKLSKITFYEFATKEIQNLRDQERFGNASVYETAVNRFVGFTGKAITLDKINYNVIYDFDTKLIKEGLCRNTIAIYMREIRALLNQAIKKGMVDRKNYPFHDFKIKTEKTVNRAIKKIDLVKIKQIPLGENTVIWHSRNIFFLIYNLIGISIIDLVLLKPESIQQGRIVYRRRKTGKMYSIKITAEAQNILNIYKKEDSKYLISYFNFDEVSKSEVREQTGLRIKTCNYYLKKLGKLCDLPIPLTTYVARYTWANVSKSLGYPKDQIAEALGHEYGNRITGIYLDNYGNEVIDEMNKKVTFF